MKIIYRGGYNPNVEASIKKSFWYDYTSLINKIVNSGEKVAVVTLAKPDGYYDQFIRQHAKGVDIINSRKTSINWGDYAAVFLPGGDSSILYTELNNRGFALNKLKNDALVLGDSAGAYVLSSYFYYSPVGENRGKIIEFREGFNKELNIITIAHTNNPIYTNDILIAKVEKFAGSKNLKIIRLAENEEKSFI